MNDYSAVLIGIGLISFVGFLLVVAIAASHIKELKEQKDHRITSFLEVLLWGIVAFISLIVTLISFYWCCHTL